MPESKEHFRFTGGKRTILAVDDEKISRELLSLSLSQDYEVLFAENGEEALAIIREKRNELSLVLLDVMTPGIQGLELLTNMKADPTFKSVPVITLTHDQEAAVKSLRLGAIDYIPKPCPPREAILARVRRAIELSEARDIIRLTERDTLTGLYSQESFYRYARQLDQSHRDVPMDAIVVNVQRFRRINERFGKALGDSVLKRLGEKIQSAVLPRGGIACRKEADTFLIYCPHPKDYGPLPECASIGLSGEDGREIRICLRIGVYENADREIEMERRFDRAKTAADTLRGGCHTAIAFYDAALREKDIYSEQLLRDFKQAIAQGQFQIYYQPKFDIRPDTPVLFSAEALVRWKHPVFGMIGPGVFIPLLEQNGLIQQLDRFVWRQAAAQIREWKETCVSSVPVSVNVSRADLYDPGLAEIFRSLLIDNQLRPEELLLEVSESACAEDSAQIMKALSRLRDMGFRIVMDDFGSGHSSLNTISSLPMDALKLDMKFIRDAFQNGRNTRLIEMIIDIADHLSVPVIAEGVETREQLDTLKALGCIIAQGYYFSRPVPADSCRGFLLEKKKQLEKEERKTPDPMEHNRVAGRFVPIRIAQALATDYICIYYVDTKSDYFMEYSASQAYKTLGLEKEGDDFFALCAKNIKRVVNEKDQEMMLAAFRKETLLEEVKKNGAYTVSYRLNMGSGQSIYASLKATNMADAGDRHIVIGISNIDAQIRREKELGLARERAYRDSLTGVKSKYAFLDAKEQLNKMIALHSSVPFAIVMCDLNGLKETNDTKGHSMGDRLILEASRVICDIFKHSPVFRIGGDEFVAILRGQDYEKREALMRSMCENNRRGKENGAAIIACGLSDFDEKTDESVESVFERADQKMYENKKALKAGIVN